VCKCWPPVISTDHFFAIGPLLFKLHETQNRVRRSSPAGLISMWESTASRPDARHKLIVVMSVLSDTVQSARYLLAFQG
jgi:preprotein translocase subunit Sec61beta